MVAGIRGAVGGPSANILVAFCSEMPLICSSTLRGLCHLSRILCYIISCVDVRICHRLNSIESSINYKLDISGRQTGDTLSTPVSTDARDLGNIYSYFKHC